MQVVTFWVWFVLLLVGSFGLTLLADAIVTPKKAQLFFWQHWWHAPILALGSFGLYFVVDLATYQGGTIYDILRQEAFATFVTFVLAAALWLRAVPEIRSERLGPSTCIILAPASLLFGLVTRFTCPFTDMQGCLVWFWRSSVYLAGGLVLLLAGLLWLWKTTRQATAK